MPPMRIQEFNGVPGLSERYTIVREIGRGGMAVVYLANDVRHDRQVAVKLLLPELSEAIGADRFAREIRTVARLQHPHILPLFDSGSANGTLYFVMPFVDGESLRDLLNREKAISLPSATRVIRQIGDALDYAHEHGVVHRDVKPENILLAGGQALLADFGVARAHANNELETLTSLGMTPGTPTYMSPEQASGEHDTDGRSDLYALGCIAYEMLSGVPPFVGKNAMATMAQHVTKQPPALIALQGEISLSVVAAVMRMLSKNPVDRFESAAAFAVVLETALIVPSEQSIAAGTVPLIGVLASATQSVFVIDFTNLSQSPDVDWLAGGIAETVSVDLRKISGVRVVGSEAPVRQRMAALRRDQAIGVDAACTLGKSVAAHWVIWGAYQKSGTRIRLTPQFANTETGDVLSLEKIDGNMDDIFAMQDRIVMQLALHLRIELTSYEAAQVAKPETAHISAYELYARGKQAGLLFGTESARAAGEYFRQAIVIDPNYALAWSGLGSLLMPKYISTGSAAVLQEGVEALQRAMSLDPSLGEPYTYLAYMYVQQGRYSESIQAARTSIEREPGASFAWYLLALPLLSRAVTTGSLLDLTRAMLTLLRCRAMNPAFHPASMAAGWIYVLRGEYAHGTLLIDEAVARERAGTGLIFLGALVMRANLHARLRETQTAISMFDVAISKYAAMDHVYAIYMGAWALNSRGRAAEVIGDLESAHRDYETALQLAEANEHRLGIGAQWIFATLGRSRLAHHRGDRLQSDALIRDAVLMLERRNRFNWISIPSAMVPEILYDVAATHGCRGEPDLALELLARSAKHGWADPIQLLSDRNFDDLRNTEPLQQLLKTSQTLATLPQPSGAGGYPEFEEVHSGLAPIPPAS